MKTACCLMVPLLLASAGCLEMPLFRGETKTAPPPPRVVEKKPVRTPAPVTAEQVTEGNAQAKARELEEEITRDEQDHTKATLPDPKGTEKTERK
jgi:hypothetical protein